MIPPDHFFQIVLPRYLTVFNNSFLAKDLSFLSFQGFAFFLGGITAYACRSEMTFLQYFVS